MRGIYIEDEQIKAVKQWLESKLVRDIQVFIKFANFYWQFIQGFSRIAELLTSMLKTTEIIGSATNPKETKGVIGSNNVISNVAGGGEATNLTKRKNLVKTTRSKILVKSKNHDFLKSRSEEAGTGFLTLEARQTFTQLRQAFVKAPILHYFN